MNNIRIFDNPGTLFEAAALHIAELSKNCIATNGQFTIALSGGNTPRKLYELLAQKPWSILLEWKNIFVFWGDERCVPLSDVNNNAHMASVALLNHVPIPTENIFPIPVNLEPAKAASSYEETVKTFFKKNPPRFDLILLGLGDDGHTASLFPYTEILNDSGEHIKEVFIKETRKYRISFTPGLINEAKNILFLVTGHGKAPIMKTIFSPGQDSQKYPAQLVKPVAGTLAWYVDQEAASKLKN